MKIEVRGLGKKYIGSSNEALSDVNAVFETGHIYGLLGRNGAGKSTLLNIITDKFGPSRGEVLMDGEPLKKDSQLERIYMMSEGNYFLSDRPIRKLFKDLSYVYPSFDLDKANRLAEEFGINTKKCWDKLSTGYRTIFKMIPALSVNVPFVIFDEPILGLDAVHRDIFYREVISLFSENPDTCIIISTHLIEEVSHLLSDVVILNDGKVMLQAETDELSQNALCITGEKEEVMKAAFSMKRIAYREMGSIASFYGFGKPNDADVKIESIDLQRLFILLTNGGRV